MSIQIMNLVWEQSKASGRQKLVLLAIADHQGEIGAWPSIETIAGMVNASPRSVQRDIQELVKLGELEVSVQAAPSRGQYKANLYWVLPGVTKKPSGVTDSVSGVTESAAGVTIDGALTLIETLPKPYRNPETQKRKKAVTSMPKNWQPSQQLQESFSEKWPTLKLAVELDAFTNWHVSKGSQFADWDAALRTWLNNAVKFQAAKTGDAPRREIKGYK